MSSRRGRRIIFIVVWNIVVVLLVFAACEAMLRYYYHTPHTLVRAKYYDDKLGDFDPNINVIDDRVKHYPYHFSTNSEGFRSLVAIARKKGKNTVRILCLGDSFTMGWGVDDKATYPELLRQDLAGKYPDMHIEVINAGNIFSNILDEVDYFNTKGIKLHPDLVILQFYSNDIYNEMARGYVDRIYNRVTLQQYKNKFVAAIHRTLENLALYNLLARYVTKAEAPQEMPRDHSLYGSYQFNADERFLDSLLVRGFKGQDTASNLNELLQEKNNAANAPLWDNYGKALVHFDKKLKDLHIPFLFIAIPSSLLMYRDYNAPMCSFSPLTTAHNINFIDFTHIFRAYSKNHWEQFYLHGDGHTNPQGNTLLAAVLADAIGIERAPDGQPAVRLHPDGFRKNCQEAHRVTLLQKDRELVLNPEDGFIKDFKEQYVNMVVPTLEQARNGFSFFENKGGGAALVLSFRFAEKIANFDMLFTKNLYNDGTKNNSYTVSYAVDGGPLLAASDDSGQGKTGWTMEQRVIDVALPHPADNLTIRFDFRNKAGLVTGNTFSKHADDFCTLQFFGLAR